MFRRKKEIEKRREKISKPLETITEKFITLAHGKNERPIAAKLAEALHTDPIPLENLLTRKARLPPEQTRLSFYGHSNGEVFGGDGQFYNEEAFVKNLIHILEKNPSIREIDLLSCNVGAMDAEGRCYAANVKEQLLEAGHDIEVNTFLVDNRDNSIRMSFFVVGSDAAEQEMMNVKKDLLKASEFSLDVIRLNQPELNQLYDLYWEKKHDLIDKSMKLKIVNAFYKIISKAVTQELSGEEMMNILKDTLRGKKIFRHLSNKKLDHIIKSLDIVFFSSPPFIRLVINDQKCALSFEKDISRLKDYLSSMKIDAQHQFKLVANQFALLRATEARVYKGDIAEIRSFLKPVSILKLDEMKEDEKKDLHIQSEAQAYLKHTRISDFHIFSQASDTLQAKASVNEEKLIHQTAKKNTS